MRLIDADALKEAIIELNLDNSSHWSVIYKIDNAPTICERYRSFCMAKPERPKGEWINEHCVDIGYKTAECSCCGERSRLISHDTGFGHKYEYYPFCHWCGADMRKEAENDTTGN